MDLVHFIPPAHRRACMLAAQADAAPVLIAGASGTGKEGLVRWIHKNSPRTLKPLITATPGNPLEAQLLRAQEGSLYIPELAALPLGEQAVLLDLIKTRTLRPTQADGIRRLLNVRIMAGTGHDLKKRSEGGMFSRDLFEAFKEFNLAMPGLKDRGEEFDDIASALLTEITLELRKSFVREISSEAWSALRAYDWPGNLRELRNILRVAVVRAQGSKIELTDLPDLKQQDLDFRASREAFDRIYLSEILKTSGGDVQKASEITKIEVSVLSDRLRRHGLTI
jgi:DNA-binding NtrC family response regulator